MSYLSTLLGNAPPTDETITKTTNLRDWEVKSQTTDTPPASPRPTGFFMAKVYTRDELKAMAHQLTYALPGLYQPVRARRVVKPGSTVRKNGKTYKASIVSKPHVPRMLTPDQAHYMNKPFNIIQTTKLARISSSITIEVDGGYNFTFNQINQYTELSNVFDQYRFVLIEIMFKPTIQALSAGSQSALFYSAIDTDDSSSTTAASVRDYPGCKTTECFLPHTHTWAPHVAIAAYAGAFTSFANETSPWIDVASPNVQHYGLKYAFDVTTVPFTYDVIARIHVQLRNVR
jgi:hypothetical protein